MKKIILTIAFMLTFALMANAQMKWITVIKGTSIRFYTNLTNAVDAAEAGSDIIIPGGVWPKPNGINKELHLYGVGHYPSYTGTTEKTVISGTNNVIQICCGGSNTTLTGLEIIGTTTGFSAVEITDYFKDPSGNYTAINNVQISRCKINGLRLAAATNCKISECVLTGRVENYGSYHGFNSNQCILEKNIFSESYFTYGFYYATFDHNIFIKPQTGWAFPVYYSIITNNIFIGNFPTGQSIYGCNAQNIFSNNLTMLEPITFAPECHEILANNISNVDISNIFVNYTGGGFDYNYDFQLKSTCPGKGAGTDGTDLGIYGTASPYKDGAVPVIPHYTTSEIGGQLIDGKLHINVTVEAQTK